MTGAFNQQTSVRTQQREATILALAIAPVPSPTWMTAGSSPLVVMVGGESDVAEPAYALWI